MLKITGYVFLVVLLAGAVAIGQTDTVASDYTGDYREAAADYYDVTIETVSVVAKTGIAEDELPVAFFIAASAEVSPVTVANERAQGGSWHDVGNSHGVHAGDFYVPPSGQLSVDAFIKIYGRYKGAKRHEFHRIKLMDQDIINLVNLRFISLAEFIMPIVPYYWTHLCLGRWHYQKQH